MRTGKLTLVPLNSKRYAGMHSCMPVLPYSGSANLNVKGYSQMRFRCFVLLVLAGVAYGQTEPPATPAASGVRLAKIASSAIDQAPAVKVEPDDPVITLNGFCADLERQGDSCKTTITRAQFEKLTHALQPGMSLPLRLKVANAYARNLRMSATAEKRGLDKTPEFEEEMRFRADATSRSRPGPCASGGGQQNHRSRSRRLLQEE